MRNSLEFGGITLRNGTYAVVESTVFDAEEDGNVQSDLFVPYLKDVEMDANGVITGRNFYLADTDAIVSPCAVIPDIGGPPNRYYMVKSRREWHKDFISWVRRPHEEDDMNEVLDNENDE